MGIGTASAGACKLSACSESQVTSSCDFSTNYCNLHDLYCGTAAGCKIVHHDLTFEETQNSCNNCGAPDASKCLIGRLGVVARCGLGAGSGLSQVCLSTEWFID